MLGVWHLCYDECWVKLNIGQPSVCCSYQCPDPLAQHHINSENMLVGRSRNRILKWELSGEREKEKVSLQKRWEVGFSLTFS